MANSNMLNIETNMSSEYDPEKHEASKKYKRAWYAKNSEKLKVKAREKVVCECGMEITRSNLYKHRESIKHKQIMKNRPSVNTE